MDPEKITYFAITDSRNKRLQFGIKAKDRSKHVYVIGKTGMGKSTLLENMLVQDIKNGEGIAFIDPHGASAEKILDYIPEERIDDVLYFAPFDLDNPVAFNVMEDVGYDKRHLVVSGLMSAFEKIWADQWSARMEYILTNTLLALLEYPDATMLGISKMYSDKIYRKKVVDNVKDPLVKAFWEEEFAKFTDSYSREATPAIQNKIGQFTGNPLIRNIIGQPKSSFDLREMIDNRKIIIINLSKGRVGEINANLLGSMIITKIYLAAMARADVSEGELNKLPNFYFYVDEFQSFANESFADILSEARKYKLNLTIAHQYIEQMSEEVRAAVFGNVGTMMTFRVGAFDSEILEKEFAPTFYAQDLVNLGFTQIYLKLMIDGVASQPFSATTLPPIEPPSVSYKDQVILASRRKYGSERSKVEEKIAQSVAPAVSVSTQAQSKDTPKADSRGGEKRPAPSSRGDGKDNVGGERTRQEQTKPEYKQDRRMQGHVASQSEPQPQPQSQLQSQPQPQPQSQTQPQAKTQPQIEASQHKEQFARIGEQMRKNEVNQKRDQDRNQGAHENKKRDTRPVQDKGPSDANRSSLRDALSVAMKEKPKEEQEVPKPKREEPQVKEDIQKEAPKETTKEVPEDVLRNMLEVKE